MDKDRVVIAELPYNLTGWKQFTAFHSHTWGIKTDNDYTGYINVKYDPEFEFDSDFSLLNFSVRGKPYAKVDTVNAVQETEASYYYSRADELFLVHFEGNKNPFDYSNEELLFSFALGVYRATGEIEPTWNNQQYYPRLISTPKIQQKKTDLYFSKQAFVSGSVEFDNSDYKFVKYGSGLDVTSKTGQYLRVLEWVGNLEDGNPNYDDFDVIYQGVVEKIDESNEIKIKTKDIRRVYDKKSPSTILDNSLFPYLKDADKEYLIPQIWGECHEVPCLCLNEDVNNENEIGPWTKYDFMLCDSKLNGYSDVSDQNVKLWIPYITVKSVIGSTDGDLSEYKDYTIGWDDDQEYGIIIKDSTTVTTESQNITITYDFPAFGVYGAMDVITSGSWSYDTIETITNASYTLTSPIKGIFINGVRNKRYFPVIKEDTLAGIYYFTLEVNPFVTFDDDSNASFENQNEVAVTIEGYLDNDKDLINNSLHIIRELFYQNYSVPYSSVYYNTAVWSGFETTAYKAGLYLGTDKPRKVQDLVEDLAGSNLGEFTIDADRKFSFNNDDFDSVKFEISKYEFFPADYVPKVSSDSTEVLASFRVGVRKKWRKNKEYEWLTDDTNSENALLSYNSQEQKDFMTLLTDDADVSDYNDRVHFFGDIPNDRINVSVPWKYRTLNKGEYIAIEYDLPEQDFMGWLLCQVQTVALDTKEYKVNLELRVFKYGYYVALADENGVPITNENNDILVIQNTL